MEVKKIFKSIIDHDTSEVVVCDIDHRIIYMNPVAISQYERWGGAELLGKSILHCHSKKAQDLIVKVVDWFKENVKNNIVHTYYNEKENKDVYMVALRDEDDALLGYYEKHEYRNQDMSPLYDFK